MCSATRSFRQPVEGADRRVAHVCGIYQACSGQDPNRHAASSPRVPEHAELDMHSMNHRRSLFIWSACSITYGVSPNAASGGLSKC